MTARTQQDRTPTNNTPPANNALLPGQLFVEMGTPLRLWIGVPTSIAPTGNKLLFDGAAQYALINSPVFTGDPQAPTPSPGDADTSVATTAFVSAAVSAATATANHNVGRNLLHNPLFNVAQRGAGPFTANGAYTLDRWQLNLGAGTASVAAFGLIDADRTAIGDEQVSTALRNVFTGNAAGDSYMIHKVENVSRLSGKTVTLSLWARSGVALKLGLNLAQVFGTGGSPSAPVWATAVAASVTPTWTRYSATFALPSAAGKTFGTNGDSSTWVTLWYSAGTTNNALSGNIGVQSGTIDVWGVQLEIGSAATPLEKPDPRYDLANAQRFYQTGQIISAANVAAGGAFYASAYFAVAMRTAPTIATNTNTSVNIGAITWLALTNGSGAAATTAATAAGAVSINATFTASADL